YYPTVKLSLPIAVQMALNQAQPPVQTAISTLTPSRPAEETNAASPPPAHVLPGQADIISINFHVYNQNFDEIPPEQKQKAIVTILNTLPSVHDMRDWLQKNTKVGEEASLKRWLARVSPVALGVLRWIIASNRSCIVALQD